jgi:ABC-type Zn2+ transport system substrate-binding protein/surface adhesin
MNQRDEGLRGVVRDGMWSYDLEIARSPTSSTFLVPIDRLLSQPIHIFLLSDHTSLPQFSMRQRNTTGADSSSSDDQATSIKPVAAAPTSPATEKRAATHGHSHGHHHDDEDEHDHDHPIDEEKRK